MKKTAYLFLTMLGSFIGILSGCRQGTETTSKQEIAVLDNEKWWGGAVLDGRNSPLNDKQFVYDQYADCKTNQAAPFFISDKGRYIWSEKPLKIEFTAGKIIVESRGGEVIWGKEGETLRDAYMYGSRNFFPASGKIPDQLLITSP